MIDMKATATFIALGWLVCGASACFADSGTPQLLGEWAKIVKVDAHQPQSQDARTQFDSSEMEFVFTKQEGGFATGTKSTKTGQVAVTCEIGGDNRTIVCEDESGIFQGEIDRGDEMVGIFRASGDSSTLSTLVLRKKK